MGQLWGKEEGDAGVERKVFGFFGLRKKKKKRKRKGAEGKACAQHVEANKEEKGRAGLYKERRRLGA